MSIGEFMKILTVSAVGIAISLAVLYFNKTRK